MARKKTELPDTILRLLPLSPAVFFCLFALADGAKHGYAIMQETTTLSGGKFRMGAGTLYSTIQRLVELDLIEEMAADDRRRYYKPVRLRRSAPELRTGACATSWQLAGERTLCRS